MYSLDELVGPNDITSVREIALDNGNILYLRRTDPYGFFVFSLARGQLPDWIKGSYTSLSDAKKAAQQYLTERQFEQAKKIELASPKADSTKKKA